MKEVAEKIGISARRFMDVFRDETGMSPKAWSRKQNKMSAYLYVDDVDAWYRRALDAGAASQSEPADQAYGDRTAGVTDPWGNNWWLGKPLDE